jgi:hypothetical protein
LSAIGAGPYHQLVVEGRDREERRSKARERVWFPLTVTVEGGAEGTAISYDVSAAGLQMASPGPLEEGVAVTLRFRRSPDAAEEVEVLGDVVRVEERPSEGAPWRYRLAVRFREARPDLEGILDRWREEP